MNGKAYNCVPKLALTASDNAFMVLIVWSGLHCSINTINLKPIDTNLTLNI